MTDTPRWVTASGCTGGSCVEVAATDATVHIRNSTTPNVVVRLTRAEWAAFVDRVNAGDFSGGDT